MTKRILLCDDEIHILRAAEFKFKRAGYDVACASDGQEGWEQVLAFQPDIVVTDCQMPRVNGLQLAERINSTPETSHVPVIMLSGKGFELSSVELRERFGIRCLMAPSAHASCSPASRRSWRAEDAPAQIATAP
jgi:DNA-binding response OmpR family regulator